MKKRISILIVLVLFLFLTACSPKRKSFTPSAQTAYITQPVTESEPTSISGTESVQDVYSMHSASDEDTFAVLIDRSSEALRNLRSMHLDMKTDMDINTVFAIGEAKMKIPVSADLSCNMDLISEPYRYRAEMVVKALGQNSRIITYGEGSKEDMTFYVSSDGGKTWTRQSGDSGIGIDFSALADLIKNADEMEQKGNETVNGRETVVFAGKMSSRQLAVLLQNISSETTFSVFENTSDLNIIIPLTVCFDTGTYLPVRLIMDLSGFMDTILQNDAFTAAAGMSDSNYSLSCQSAEMQIDLSQFDAVPLFEIPPEARQN